MDNSDLLLYAKEYATTQDLYELLGVTSDTSKEDIHRAWRKRSLKYHPDKAGANFDSTKWELFERARDVLSDSAARNAYDSQRSAALVREEQRRAMDAKKRAMVEDLEARERGAIKNPRDESNGPTMNEEERKRLLEAGKRRMEERQRLMREAEKRERQREWEKGKERADEENRQKSKPPSPADCKMDVDPPPAAKKGDDQDDRIANLEQRLKEIQERKAAKKQKRAARKAGDKRGAYATSSTTETIPYDGVFSPSPSGYSNYSATTQYAVGADKKDHNFVDNLPTGTIILPCEFVGIGNCGMTFGFDKIQEWIEHIITSHLHDFYPKKVGCWFCDDFVFDADVTAGGRRHVNFWYRMDHIRGHIADGKTADDMRFDLHMLEHMRAFLFIPDGIYNMARQLCELPRGSKGAEHIHPPIIPSERTTQQNHNSRVVNEPDRRSQGQGDFSSTMARLRAAQAEKEAKKAAEQVADSGISEGRGFVLR